MELGNQIFERSTQLRILPLAWDEFVAEGAIEVVRDPSVPIASRTSDSLYSDETL